MKHLSPTAIKLFRSDQQEFYLKYIAEYRPPKIPQTPQMAMGSVFDAFVKYNLIKALYGDVPEKYDLRRLFEAQVEEQNRDFVWPHGQHIFDGYKKCGAFADLLADLRDALGEPRFEFDLQVIIQGIPFYMKPDVYFIHKNGSHIILDFKVNGYMSKTPRSPQKGYVLLRDGWTTIERDHMRYHGECHKNAQIMEINGVKVNVADTMDNINEEWAMQTSMYGWGVGEDIGASPVVAIDQIVGCGYEEGKFPWIRVASHRSKVSSDYQYRLWQEIQEIWEICNSDWFFKDLSKGESQERCSMLDAAYEVKNEKDEWFAKAVRG